MRSFIELLEHATMKAEESSGPHRDFWMGKLADMDGRDESGKTEAKEA